MLSNFIGDLGTGGTNGLVPAPAAGDGATKFLKADGTWSIPAGGGGGITSIANEGTGSGVWDTTLAGVATLRSIKAGANISVALGGVGNSEIQVSATGVVLSGASLGTGSAVFSGQVGSALQFNSIAAGAGIGVSLAANTITVANSGILSVTNVTGFSGTPVFSATAAGVASLRTIKAGSNVTVTLGGTGNSDITIASTGGTAFAWNQVAVAGPTPVVANNGYIATGGVLVEFQLPPTAAVGDTISFTNIPANSTFNYRVKANAGQTIGFSGGGSTVGGSITSTTVDDTLQLVCTILNTRWTVLGSVGANFTPA